MLGFLAFSVAPRSRGLRRGVAAAVLVTVLFVAGAASATHTDGQVRDALGPDVGPIPVLSLSLTPNQLQAEVTQSQLGAVTFDGTVTVDQMRLMSSTVTLAAVVSAGWPVVLSPQTIEMTGPGEEPFLVTVIVPPATSALLTANVIVNGACKAPGLSPVVASASAVVTVAPYYKGRITSSNGNIMVDSGESKNIEVMVYNDGNAEAQMRIYVQDKPREVRISFSETEFSIRQDEFICITVRISAISGARSGDYPVGLVVEADNRDGSTEKVASYNMSVNIPSLRSKLGTSGMVSIIVIVIAQTGVFILWRMGRLRWLKGIKLPRRSSS